MFLPPFIGDLGHRGLIYQKIESMYSISAYSDDEYSYFDPRICVIGLGHTGLFHAISFSEHYRTIAYDPDQERTRELSQGRDSKAQISADLLQQGMRNGLAFTSETADIHNCNFYVITVPSQPAGISEPDLLPLWSACELVGQVISGGDIVVFDSCGCPSTTENKCIPLVEKVSGLLCNCDFFAGYSPGPLLFEEKGFTSWTEGKITSGSTPEIAKIMDEVYITVFGKDIAMAPIRQSNISGVL